ncbi:MAG: molybdopterin-dependent oxidoreductase [Thermomicrobiales bacterium]
MRRVGAGSTNYDDLSWNEAFDAFAEVVRGAQGSALFITEPLSGALKQVVDAFIEGIGGERIVFDPLEEAVLLEAVNRVFGVSQIPFADIGNAQTVLSFGADWLHTWMSPVQYGQGYSQFRKDDEGSPRGVLYHVDSNINGTSGMADRWLAVNPGYEGMVAMAIAGAIMENGGGSNADAFNAVTGGADLPSPEDAESQTGVSADAIREVADRLVNSGPSVVFGGGNSGAHTNGLSNLTAIYALNLLLGNINSPVACTLPAAPEVPSKDSSATPARATKPGATWCPEYRAANSARSLSIRLTLFMEHPGVKSSARHCRTPIRLSASPAISTRRRSTRICSSRPDCARSWNTVMPAVTPGYPVVGFQQPVVLRFYDTQAVGDVLLTIAEEVGLGDAMPWATMQQVVQEQAEALRTSTAGNIQAANDPSLY